ncbi:MAG: fructose 1,6-bisphosphatase, partial [Candidatus Aminicenantes bacterium]|nr:fructose 1,6-bisphosphatase [Candidatus Aminicenantes bacterium]
MKVTLSVLKADVGSIGGHIVPSKALIETIRTFVQEDNKDLVIDSYISHT